jgi:hypothetical protein
MSDHCLEMFAAKLHRRHSFTCVSRLREVSRKKVFLKNFFST